MKLEYETIKDFFEKNKKKYYLKELKKEFNCYTKEDILTLKQILKQLEINKLVIIDDEKETVVSFPKNSDFIIDIIHINKVQHGFIGKDYYVPKLALNGALSGDLVLARKKDYIACEINGKTIAEVVKIIKRKKNNYIATYDGKKFNIYGHNNIENLKIINIEDKIFSPGDRILLEIEENYAKFISFIGHKDDPNLDILTIAATYEIPTTFSNETKKELENIPVKVTPEELKNRENFTVYPIVTIDCDQTKDMDDAVFVRILPNGNYELQVHIAHVSHYIKKDSNIYKEAIERSNSTYMLNSVIPMIPHQLSNGICSLNPNELRLTRSTIMEISKTGEIIDFRLTKGYIISRKKMSYSKVNSILEEKIIPSDYKPYVDNILLMNKLATILREKFKNSGLIDFEIPEVTSELDSFNKAYNFQKNTQRSAEKLIESFMIAANICNANYCKWNNIPTIYRTHDNPDNKKLIETINFISSLGYQIKKSQNLNNPKYIQNILKTLKDREEFPILSSILLQGMKKAKYSCINQGHFALSLSSYSHSTSPIRRIADLTMQYNLDEYEEYLENPQELDFTLVEKELELIAQKANIMERKAAAAEEEATLMQMAWYMQDNIGKTYEAYISDINYYGITICTINNIKGKVNFKDIMGDYYEYDNNSRTIKGRKTKTILKIGDKVLVESTYASKEYRSIYFKILQPIKDETKQRTLKKIS